MDSDRDIQAIIDDPATSYWLSDALKAALKRDPHNAALDAEVLAIILAKRADEHAAHALAWIVVQRAATGE